VSSQKQSIRHKLDHRDVDLKSLFEISQIINASLDVDRVLNNCLLTPMGRMLISRAMALSAREDGSFEVKVVKGLPADFIGKTLLFKYHLAEPLLIRQASEEQCSNKDLLLSHGIELIIPMRSDNKMVGAICLGGKISGQDFTRSEIEFLSSLSNIAASAVENALIFEKLKQVNRQLDKKVQELKTLFSVGQELNSTLDTYKILNILIFTVMGEMTANKILVYLQNENGVELAGKRGVAPDDLKFLQEHNDQLENIWPGLKTTRAIADNQDDEFYQWYKIGLRAVIPMQIQDQTRGILLLGQKASKQPFQADELEFLATLCNRAMISLENARLFQETLEKQRLEEEMAIAREIQQRLLPTSFPQATDFEIYGLNIPSLQVGGDYFDCFQLNDNRLIFAIGDVSGKGVGASLLMSNLHAGLHTMVQSKADVCTIVARLNDLIYANTNFDKFITFFYAEIDPVSKRLQYVNAGHNPPYIFHAGGEFELLEKGGLVLGMMAGVQYEMGEIILRPGDRLVAFTDGVTEAIATSGEMFEEQRLESLIDRGMTERIDLREFADLLISELENFSQGEPQADDITMLALHVKE